MSFISRALKTLTTQTNEDGKEGTAVGRLLKTATSNPLAQVGISVADAFVEGGLELIDRDDAPKDVKDVLIETAKNTEGDLVMFGMELLEAAVQAHDMPFVEGPYEQVADDSVINFVRAFVEQRKANSQNG